MNKPRGMSLLDYLWTNYGNAALSNTVSKNPSDEVILTESAIINYINSLNNDVNIKIESVEKDNQICIIVKDLDGNILNKICIDKGATIVKFDKFISTLEDVDKGNSTRVGNLCLTLQDSLGNEYFVELPELKYKGLETDSIVTAVVNNSVASTLKINNPVLERSIDIKTTPDGIRADLIIDLENNGSITITKGTEGISCHYKWQDEDNEIKLKALTSNEYYLLKTIDLGTLYFITDLPCIYFRKIKYASSTALIDYITIDLAHELFNQYLKELIDDIEELDLKLVEVTSYVESNRDRLSKVETDLKEVQNTLLKLEGEGEGSILSIVDNRINNVLEWHII